MDSLVFSGKKYNRSHSKQTTQLSNILKKRYGVDSAYILPSGLCAISTALNVCCQYYKPKLILYANELYCTTPDIIKYLSKVYNTSTIKFNLNNFNTITKKIEKNISENDTVLIFSESCSNPNGLMFDYSILKTFKKYKIITIIDNTWLTSAIQNPFILGADVVVSSLTKYYSAGTAIGGVILSKTKDHNELIEQWILLNGLHTSPYNAKLIIDNITTLDKRICQSSKITLEIIHELQKNYPTLKINHPIINKVKLNMYPSVFTINIPNIYKEKKYNSYKLKHELDKLLNITDIEYKTSFGGNMSKIDTYPKCINDYISVRISIGYDDDTKKVVSELKKILSQVM